ncbi:MAG: DUF3267 domain-containing protein [Clostridia bacterium]|nr:DUF3267 domain-containing protein [Clostridia bacterium]
MKTQTVLPENYSKIFDIDLKENKKMAAIVNIAGVVIAGVMILIALRFHSVDALFDMSEGLGAYIARFAIIIVGSLVYIIVHELIHGFFMKRYSGMKPKYGYTFVYAYAGSDAYFNKRDYLIIALSPLVILGVVIAIINAFVPETWFWVIYFIQITNISGAAGDLYVTVKLLKQPSDILITDSGVAMKVYAPEK